MPPIRFMAVSQNIWIGSSSRRRARLCALSFFAATPESLFSRSSLSSEARRARTPARLSAATSCIVARRRSIMEAALFNFPASSRKGLSPTVLLCFALLLKDARRSPIVGPEPVIFDPPLSGSSRTSLSSLSSVDRACIMFVTEFLRRFAWSSEACVALFTSGRPCGSTRGEDSRFRPDILAGGGGGAEGRMGLHG